MKLLLLFVLLFPAPLVDSLAATPIVKPKPIPNPLPPPTGPIDPDVHYFA